MARAQQCNILSSGSGPRRIWQFDTRKKELTLGREQTVNQGQSVPSAIAGKGWSQYWAPKLNVAWLPVEKVFLRAVQLPVTDAAETRTMIEFQLEKLSPLPVTQVVWSFHILPAPAAPRFANTPPPTPGAEAAASDATTVENTQTVIVAIAERSFVEEELGNLEQSGFYADRLDVPLIDQLEQHTEDGAWIFVSENGAPNALVAWRQDGRLHNLSLLRLPASPTDTVTLRGQVEQLVWAGQLEGWLTAAPKWHLVAGHAGAEWQAAFATVLGDTPKLVAPPAPAQLAAASARRVLPDTATGLLPEEFAARYKQKFTDNLWWGGMKVVGGLYLVGIIIYFAALLMLKHKTGTAEGQVADLGLSYTNAVQLKARYYILRDRQDLKFAALDCWKAVAENLPSGAQLNALDFRDGRKLVIQGTAGSDQATSIIDFNTALHKVEVNGEILFSRVDSPSLTSSGNQLTWSFAAELNKTEDKQ